MAPTSLPPACTNVVPTCEGQGQVDGLDYTFDACDAQCFSRWSPSANTLRVSYVFEDQQWDLVVPADLPAHATLDVTDPRISLQLHLDDEVLTATEGTLRLDYDRMAISQPLTITFDVRAGTRSAHGDLHFQID